MRSRLLLCPQPGLTAPVMEHTEQIVECAACGRRLKAKIRSISGALVVEPHDCPAREKDEEN